MKTTPFEKALWIALALTVTGILALSVPGRNSTQESTGLQRNRQQEQQLMAEARRSHRQKVYEPVETLKKAGQHQQALLKLEELSRAYPGDPHGFILRGELLAALGATAEAASSFAQGIRLDGSYVDRNNPQSRRETIDTLVKSGLKSAPSPALADIRYLQSRLAGGCE